MTSHRELYPDIAAAGGLGPAVRAVAAELGLDVGEVEPFDGERVRLVGAVPGREECYFQLLPRIRCFSLDTSPRGVDRVSGLTDDLHAAVTAAAAWRHGATTREVKALAPFVRLPLLEEALARGPQDGAKYRWQELADRGEALRALGGQRWVQLFGEMVAAAYAEPRLRGLYPGTSHLMLRFSSCTTFPYDWVGALIQPCGDGFFRVWRGKRGGVLLGKSQDAREAAAVAAAALPEGVVLRG
ncbi:DUF6193 family natural product biosynthesis protein [Streptacidiphilus anmyonensis]|uniref:DUF6193 family natural product biosynthesis protein n=1 Tax=Streptacidiphilus anmyonensis TaxID=405782 RepID=UPI0006948096|nr:DUF6193 family natural product biosynthesis protein [Streptacidiphilus anmyonensis]